MSTSLDFTAAVSVCRTIESAISLLWALDKNPRWDPAQDPIRSLSPTNGDAPQQMFSDRPTYIWNRRTCKTLMALLNKTPVRLPNTAAKPVDIDAERDAFLRAVCNSDCMRFARAWLVHHVGWKIHTDDDLRLLLQDMWFLTNDEGEGEGREPLYVQHFSDVLSRSFYDEPNNTVDSAEERSARFLREKRGVMRYVGNVGIDENEECPDLDAKARAELHDPATDNKRKAMIFGVSPEFHIALYTLITLAGYDDLTTWFGPFKTRIHVAISRGVLYSAFAELLCVSFKLLGGYLDTPETYDDTTLAALRLIHGQTGKASRDQVPEEMTRNAPVLQAASAQKIPEKSISSSSDDDIPIALNVRVRSGAVPAFQKVASSPDSFATDLPAIDILPPEEQRSTAFFDDAVIGSVRSAAEDVTNHEIQGLDVNDGNITQAQPLGANFSFKGMTETLPYQARDGNQAAFEDGEPLPVQKLPCNEHIGNVVASQGTDRQDDFRNARHHPSIARHPNTPRKGPSRSVDRETNPMAATDCTLREREQTSGVKRKTKGAVERPSVVSARSTYVSPDLTSPEPDELGAAAPLSCYALASKLLATPRSTSNEEWEGDSHEHGTGSRGSYGRLLKRSSRPRTAREQMGGKKRTWEDYELEMVSCEKRVR